MLTSFVKIKQVFVWSFCFILIAGGGWLTFFVFKSLDNNTIYSLGVDVYIHKRNLCRTKVLWVLKFGEVGTCTKENQNHNIRGNSCFLYINLSPEYSVFVESPTQKQR